MTLRDLTRTLALSCLVALPLSVGLAGCKKKPSSESKDPPPSMGATMGTMPNKHDAKGSMDPVGSDKQPPMGATMGAALDVSKSFADPQRPTPISPNLGEKPAMAHDGGVGTKGHKGMLPMKGLVDPAD